MGLGNLSLPPEIDLNQIDTEHWKWTEFSGLWYRWDTEWYVRIVQEEYTYNPNDVSTVSFFPLYPTLMRLLTPLVGNPINAGLIISHLCGLVGFILFYRLTYLETRSRKISQRAVIAMSIFPASLFFSAVYTESLFLLLTVGAAYAVRHQHWLLAGLAGALASATRVPGVMITVLLGMEWLYQQGWDFSTALQKSTWTNLLQGDLQKWGSLLTVAIAPLGLFAYMIFLNVSFGNPLSFIVSHSHNATNLGDGPFVALSIEWENILNGSNIFPYNFPLGLISIGLALLTIIPLARRFRVSYALYTLLLNFTACMGRTHLKCRSVCGRDVSCFYGFRSLGRRSPLLDVVSSDLFVYIIYFQHFVCSMVLCWLDQQFMRT